MIMSGIVDMGRHWFLIYKIRRSGIISNETSRQQPTKVQTKWIQAILGHRSTFYNEKNQYRIEGSGGGGGVFYFFIFFNFDTIFLYFYLSCPLYCFLYILAPNLSLWFIIFVYFPLSFICATYSALLFFFFMISIQNSYSRR